MVRRSTGRLVSNPEAIRRSGAWRNERRERQEGRCAPEEASSREALTSAPAGGSIMASLPADEDYARSVLAIFVLKHVRARESLGYGDVEAEFLAQNMGGRADFEAALAHAASEGWLTRALDRIRLTTLGAEEMRTVSWPLRGSAPLSSGPWPHR
jgi:hypothetical protein